MKITHLCALLAALGVLAACGKDDDVGQFRLGFGFFCLKGSR